MRLLAQVCPNEPFDMILPLRSQITLIIQFSLFLWELPFVCPICLFSCLHYPELFSVAGNLRTLSDRKANLRLVPGLILHR